MAEDIYLTIRKEKIEMLSLNDREWGVFRVGLIFDISTGSNIKRGSLNDGILPRISAKDTQNGIAQFTDTKFLNFRTNENCVSISFLGSAFYHPYLASYDMKIHSLTIKGRTMNPYIGLFLVSECKRQFKKFSYGNQLSSTDLPKQLLLLPKDNEGNPDWAFMEAYMKQKEQEILKPTIDKLCKRLIDSVLTGGGNSLLGKQWKEFYFTNVFTEIQRGKRLKKADHLQGNIPYVSSTAINNGVDGFIGNDNHTRVFSNCLSLANSGSVGSSFFHQYEFVASDHITQLKREGLDKYAYLFMIPIVSRLSEKYSFNREINDNRIKREKILLPVNESDEIDFAFMSSFMKSIEKDILGTTLKYFGNRLNNSELGGGNLKWSVFYLDEIFNIFAGKRLTKANMQVGNRPFIGATDNNNGITEWVNNTNNSLDSNVLGVNYNGSVGETFYHPYECIFSDDVKRLHLKDSVNSRYVMLYLKTIIVQQKVKYAYGYKFNEKRMQRQKLVLPVDKNGKPNWDYMEKFMRNLESQAIITYLEQYKQRISNQ